MKKISVLLFLIGLAVTVFFYVSYQGKVQKQKHGGGFKRLAAKETATILHKRHFQKNSVFHKILGKIKDRIYYFLADDYANELWEISLSDFQVKKLLSIDGDSKNLVASFSDNQLDIISLLKGIVFRYEIPEGKLLSKTTINETYLRAIFLDKENIAVKTIDQKGEGILKIVNLNLLKDVSVNRHLFVSSNDGGLAEDGHLLFNGKNIYYICFYINKFYCLDQDLSLVYQANTIDTIRSFPKVVEKKVSGSSLYKFAEPVTQSCALASVSQDKLYIHSLIPSEVDLSKFSTHHIIDQYEASNGKYEKSFYLEKQEEKMVDFLVFNDTMMVLYPSTLVLYQWK